MSKDKIEVSIKDIPEIIETLKEAEKEIEFERKSKNLFIDDLYKVCDMSLKQQQEIERLNNIINELEKDMIFDMNDYGKDLDIQTGNIYCEYHRGYCQNGKDYYDKLQELKGSDKE